MDSGGKKWFDLIEYTTYKWFWDAYTNNINLTTLNDEEIVILDDIFRIVTFIHPRAVQNLLKLALPWLLNPSKQQSQL